MADLIPAAWPRTVARFAGIFEALEGIASSYGQVFILGKLIVPGNAAATAANLMAHKRLFWVGYVSSARGVAFHVVWVALFYELFKPVSRRISLLAAFVGLVVCGLQAITALLYLAPMLVLKPGAPLGGLAGEQLQGLALVFLKMNGYAFDLDLVFFGFWCVLTGCLIFRSTFLPRILGVLRAIDGLGWITYHYRLLGIQLFTLAAAASAAAEIPL